MDNHKRKPLTAIEVFKWPEFRAFAERLGIDLYQHITRLVIEFPRHDEMVEITTESLAVDTEEFLVTDATNRDR